MSLQFYLGGAGYGKSTRVQEEIIQRSMEETDRQFIFLVPDQYTMQVQKEIVVKHLRKGIMNIDVLSFGRLYHRVLEETGCEDKVLLDDTGKNLILRKIALDMEPLLPVIGSSMKKTGYIHEVKSVISEFMQYHIAPPDVVKLMEYAGRHPALCGKLADINKIYEGFLKYIGDKYITTEETMDVLADMLPKSSFVRGSVIVLDGFTGFTPVQKRVVSGLLELGSEVIMTLTIPPQALTDASEKGSLFLLCRKTYRSISELAREIRVEKKSDIFMEGDAAIRLKDSASLAFMEKEIFRGNPKTFPDLPQEVHLGHAMAPREEIRQVCISIRKLLKEKKYAYRDIAVVAGDLSRYAPYAGELFPHYDIPVFIDQNRKLVLNPFTEFIKSGFQVIVSNFSYESVSHFLKSGLTGLTREETDRLENYMLALKIRGRKKWERMFVRYPKYMKDDLEALEAINVSREKVMGILGPLLEIRKEQPAEEITDRLYRFIADHDTFSRIRGYADMFAQKKDFSHEKEFGQIYQKIMQLLEQISALLAGEMITPEEYLKILEAGISEITIGVIPQEVDHVMLGDIQRSRLGDIKVLFFVGVNDGLIPQSGSPGGIISDIDREFLAGCGYELAPSPREKMYIQKMYLYLCLTKPSKELYLSYSKMDGEGRSIRPSYLIGQIRQMYPLLKDEDYARLQKKAGLCGARDSELYLAQLLREYAGGGLGESEKKLLAALYRICSQADAGRALMLKRASFYRYDPVRLSGGMAQAVYGAVLENSISRLETYSKCAYSHFLNYGLKLEERENFVFANVDIGNVFHQVLEAFGNRLRDRNLKWTEFSRQEGEEILEQVLADIVTGYGESVIFSDARTSYQIERIRRILQKAIFNMQYQLKKSKYHPRDIEVRFKRIVDLGGFREHLPFTDKMYITGKIDRIDAYEEENRIYIKIVDYKSSEKKIDLVGLYRGTQLQLVVYLDQAMQDQQQKHPGREIVPGGLFYYPLIDPVMEPKSSDLEDKDAAEVFEKWLHRKLRMSGLYLEDEAVVAGLDTSGETDSDVVHLKRNKDGGLSKQSEAVSRKDLDTVVAYARHKVQELGAGMLVGEMAAKPADDMACAFCGFSEICPFDARLKGFRMQEEIKCSQEEILDKMRTELEGKKDH